MTNPYANFGHLADLLAAGEFDAADEAMLPMIREGANLSDIHHLAVKVSRDKAWRVRAAEPGFVAGWVLP